MARRRLFSYVLTVSGLVLLSAGLRDYVESLAGQDEAAHSFTQSLATAPPRPIPQDPPTEGKVFARLLIPRLSADLYVVEGDKAADLRRGPGHITGTALPGDSGNCVIAGHRDTHFRTLKDIRDGDDILLETRQGLFHYRASRIQVVSPENTSSLQPTSGAVLTLVTCYPFYYVGPAPKRFVVRAEIASDVADRTTEAPSPPFQEQRQ